MSLFKDVQQHGILHAIMLEWGKFTAPSSAGQPSMLHQVITLASSISSVGAGVLSLMGNTAPAVATLIVTGIIHFFSNVGDYLAKYDTNAVASTPTQAGTSASSISQAHQ